MPRVGQRIENPIAGDAVTFIALEPALVIDVETVAGGPGPPPHVHPRARETFEVLSGTLVLTERKREIVLRAGDTHVIEPGTPHKFASHPEEGGVTRVTVDPAGRMAECLETMYALARAGRTDKQGRPSMLQIALTFGELTDTIRAHGPPWPAQLAAFRTLAPLARRRGLKPFYADGEV